VERFAATIGSRVAGRRLFADAAGAATGVVRPDPTGLISCPRPGTMCTTRRHIRCTQGATHYSASWESIDSNFNALVQYEFENQILHALGYDNHVEMKAAERIRGTRVHQDSARDFHKRNNDSCGVAFPKSRREVRKIG
jgi:hypothetical protein